MRLLTYNLLFNGAVPDIAQIIQDERPDVICLQEIQTAEENLCFLETQGYKLADYSNSFVEKGTIYGIATYYNAEVLKVVETESSDLPRGLGELILVILRGVSYNRTIIRTEFVDVKTNKPLTIYNVHFSPWATNGIRVKQLKLTLSDTQNVTDKPIVIAGDFNYPYGRKKFEEIIEESGLKEATNNLFFTLERRYFKFLSIKMKLDYILYKNLKHHSTKKMPSYSSDHFPILAEFEIE